MKVPTSLLREVFTIEEFLGEGAYGAKYGASQVVKGRFEGRRRVVSSPGGSDLMSSGSVIVRPDVDVAPQSRATRQLTDRTYRVLDVVDGEGLTGPAYRELILGA